MTIEVRQVLIRAQVGVRQAAGTPPPALPARELERVKAQLLAECKTWLREQMLAARER